MIWLTIWVSSFACGLWTTRWWTIAVAPVASLLLGVQAVLGEAESYDMPGFGLRWGAFVAAISIVLWLAGRGVAVLLPSRPQDHNGGQEGEPGASGS